MKRQEKPLLAQLQEVAGQKIPQEDYQQNVDRWNKYGSLLDTAERQCQLHGFFFRRNLKTSFTETRRRLLMTVLGMAILVTSAMMFYEWSTFVGPAASIEELTGDIIAAATDSNMIMTSGRAGDVVGTAVFVGAFGGGMLGVLASILLVHLPDTIRFEYRPQMFIDDLFYVQRFIHGMALERKDPEVALPTLVMELPMSWIKQQSLLTGMDAMKGV